VPRASAHTLCLHGHRRVERGPLLQPDEAGECSRLTVWANAFFNTQTMPVRSILHNSIATYVLSININGLKMAQKMAQGLKKFIHQPRSRLFYLYDWIVRAQNHSWHLFL
jgi:hypothetical protein